MKEIKLTQDKSAIVDDEDFNYLSQWKWHTGHGYTVRNCYEKMDGKWKFKERIYMHRFLIDCPKDRLTDHINRNKLDNRRDNLRICTKAGNVQNVSLRKDNTSGLKGVAFYNPSHYNPTKKWVARIFYNGKNKTIGYFHTKVEAAKAYNKAAMEQFGEFAFINNIDKLEGK